MKEYIFKDREIELLEHMLENPPTKIWWDFVLYAFDYGDYYLKLECVDELADSQNKIDEAIIATLSKVDRKFESTEDTKLICQDKNIDNIYIARTLLYFTTFREYSKFTKKVRQFVQSLKKALTAKKDPFGDALSKAIGGNKEIICHPKSDHIQKAKPEYTNLIDKGLVIEIEGKCLKAYLQDNSFGFHLVNDKYFFDYEELRADVEIYDFIKIENQKKAAIPK